MLLVEGLMVQLRTRHGMHFLFLFSLYPVDGRVLRTCPAGFRLFQDQCFWFSPTPVRKNVAAAETDCDARGARLACVKDEETHNFLKMTIATTNRRPYWIGLSDRVVEGMWRHSDGTALGSFRPFRANSNFDTAWKDCVMMWPGSAYQWLYWNCRSPRNYICQKCGHGSTSQVPELSTS
ncbi:CLEC4E [Branchiostoma lanceolatum]|uniref:CLEC4E protein n=1 Tax=Branchiostoma lanceolatum TaxID=7740 RepID=A0A8J9ZMD5_BRALA|nr:CLEC4E [Branchiostoma lanceolatum]